MRTARYLAATLLLTFSLAPAAAAKDLYVNNLTGDDAFSGRDARNRADGSGPVRTIVRALELASQGDRIILAKTEKPYRESITVSGSRHSGYSFQPFVIQGNGAILDGSTPVPDEAWEHYEGPVFRFQPPRLAHQQLFLNDRPVARVAGSRFSDSPPELEPLQWCLHGGHIYFAVEPETFKLPKDYALSYAHRRVGITLYHVRRVGIVDLTVQGFQLDGISAFNSAQEVTIAGVTCRGNGRNGITVGGASQVLIDACLAGNNGDAQLLTLPCSETGIQNTVLLSNTGPGWVDQGGRVYIDGQRVEGGLEELVPEETADARP